MRLWRRRLDADRAERIAGTEGARLPAWRPDARAVAFFAGGRLKEHLFAGSTTSDLADAPQPGGATWLDDGSMLFAGTADGALTRIRNGQTRAATRLQPGDRRHAFPGRAPGGFVYVAVRDDGRRVIRLVAGDTTTDLGTTDGHAQIAGPFLLHVRDGALLAQRLDAGTGRPAGRATPIAIGVGVSNGRGLFAASPHLALFAGASAQAHELVWLDRQGRRSASASDRGDYWQVRLAPADRAAAVTMLEPQLRTLDVYVVPLQPSGLPASLTLALAADTDPVWSPDGLRVLFRSLLDGQPNLFSRLVGTPRAPIDPVLRSGADEVPSDWRAGRGGGEVLFQAPSTRRDTDLQVLNLATNTVRPVVSSTFNESDGRLSPDGRWLAYVSDEFGQADVFVQRWPAGARARVTLAGGSKPRWARDSRTLFFTRGTEIGAAELREAEPPAFSAPQTVAIVPGVRDFDAGRARDHLLAILPVASGPPPEVRAVLDWQSLLPPAQ